MVEDALVMVMFHFTMLNRKRRLKTYLEGNFFLGYNK